MDYSISDEFEPRKAMQVANPQNVQQQGFPRGHPP
jgi:hypothetical protein